jgi:hypothetical protein
VELTLASWGSISWGDIYSTEDLLDARARQLEMRQEDVLDAADKLLESRTENKRYFDNHRRKRLASQTLDTGDLVLLHNTQLEKQWSDKLANRLRGPYRIKDISAVGTAVIEECDGTQLAGTTPPDRVTRFFQRTGVIPEEGVEEEDVEEEGAEEGADAEEFSEV